MNGHAGPAIFFFAAIATVLIGTPFLLISKDRPYGLYCLSPILGGIIALIVSALHGVSL